METKEIIEQCAIDCGLAYRGTDGKIYRTNLASGDMFGLYLNICLTKVVEEKFKDEINEIKKQRRQMKHFMNER